MENVNFLKNIKKQRRIDIVAICIVSVFMFFLYICTLIGIMDSDTILNVSKDEIIRIGGTVLSILGVVSCLLSYDSNKKKELFIMSLMYTVFFIDMFIADIVSYLNIDINNYFAILTSFIRVCIIYIAFSDFNKLKNIIVNNRKASFIVITILTIIATYIEYNYIFPYEIGVVEFYEDYNAFLFIAYILIAIKFFVKSFSNKEYIYSVIGASALMFSLKSIYDFYYLVNPSINVALIGTTTVYLGFIIFILGLFIELSQNIQMNRVLDEQRNLFIKIIDENKHSCILICDENYKIKYKNEKCLYVERKYKENEHFKMEIGHKFNIEKICKERLKFDEIEEQILKSGGFSKDTYIEEIDKIIDISIQIFKINNKKYKVITIKDVSEKYELEKALLQYEKIKQEDEIKSEFFSNISHELKTPLNIIYSANQLLGFSIQKDNFKDIYIKYKDCLDINCKRMLRLIDNIVDITKLDSGFKCPQFDNYNIVKIVEEMTLSVVSYAKVKGIEILFDTDVEELDIKCDPDFLERIVLNLISNAIKFSEEGSNILVEIFSSEIWVGIKVKDDGIGIPIEIQNKIFDRFVQGDKSMRRKKEGSGIGLSLVKSLVELMDGKVYLESDGKSGTTFTILLPNKLVSEETGKGKVHKDYHVDLQRIQLELSDIYELHESEYDE